MKSKMFISLVCCQIMLFYICGCSKSDNGNEQMESMSLVQWQKLPLKKQAELFYHYRYNQSMGKDDNVFAHIETLITLSPPLDEKGRKEYQKFTAEIFSRYPYWNIKSMPEEGESMTVDKGVVENKIEDTKAASQKQVAPSSETQVENNEDHEHENPLLDEALKKANMNQRNELNSQHKSEEVHKNTVILSDKDLSKLNQKSLNKLQSKGKLPVKKEKANDSANNHITRALKLFADGDFPPGKYITFDTINTVDLNNYRKDCYYLIGNLKVISQFNDGYNCSENTEDFLGGLFNSKSNINYFVSVPEGIKTIPNGTVLKFDVRAPLSIKSGVKYTDPDGRIIIRYNCKYEGQTIHTLEK